MKQRKVNSGTSCYFKENAPWPEIVIFNITITLISNRMSFSCDFSRHTSPSFTIMTKNEDSITYPAFIFSPVVNNCYYDFKKCSDFPGLP